MENKKQTGPVLDNYLHLLYLKAKVRWSEWMNRQSTRLAPRGLKIIFIFVTSLFGTLFLLMILSGGQLLYNQPGIRPEVIQTIRAPSTAISNGATVDTLTIKQIKAFHSYMDNLAMSEDGRKTRDSIIEARPGLLDSIRILEAMYNNKKDE